MYLTNMYIYCQYERLQAVLRKCMLWRNCMGFNFCLRVNISTNPNFPSTFWNILFLKMWKSIQYETYLGKTLGMKRNTEILSTLGQYQVNKYMCNWSPRKGGSKNTWRNIHWICYKPRENHKTHELNNLQVKET